MQGIAALITTLLTQGQQLILPAVLLLAISACGYMYMIGDRKAAKEWAVGGLLGAAIVLAAQSISDLVRGAVHN